jgi:hypothetical protein
MKFGMTKRRWLKTKRIANKLFSGTMLSDLLISLSCFTLKLKMNVGCVKAVTLCGLNVIHYIDLARRKTETLVFKQLCMVTSLPASECFKNSLFNLMYLKSHLGSQTTFINVIRMPEMNQGDKSIK